MKIALFANETTLGAHLARFGAAGLSAVVLSPGRPAAAAAAERFRALHPHIPVLDYPSSTSSPPSPLPPDRLADELGIPPPADACGAFVARLRALDLDLLVVPALSRILPREVFSLPRRGAVNLHGGPLPGMRGANVVNWAVALGMRRTAATLHRVVERVDAGPVIDATPVEIGPDDDARTLRDRLVEAGLDLLGRHLPAILAGRERAVPQDESRAGRLRRRTDADGRIDWTATAAGLHDLVRALVPPWPGAHFELDGRRVTVRRSRVAAATGEPGPGRVILDADGGVAIGCGRGTLALLEVALGRSPVGSGEPAEGGTTVPAAVLLAGRERVA